MKLIKEHIIFEKFEEESDPIKDLNIGMTAYFKNAMSIFGKLDKQRYIYTIAITKNNMDFIFYIPNIQKFHDNKMKYMFDYVKNMVDKSGFKDILIKPQKFKRLYKTRNIIMPTALRYTVKSPYANLIKKGEYRRKLSRYNKSTPLEHDEFIYYGEINRNYENELSQKETDS
jgi:hypothetical protein